MQLTTHGLVEVALEKWKEMDKKDKALFLKWKEQAYPMQKYLEGFVEGYVEERGERLTEEDIKNLHKYKKEAIEIIEEMDLTL